MNDLAIIIWEFCDAPEELRNLSTNGGDEDWIAELPPKFNYRWINWLEEGRDFGCFCVDEYNHPTKPGWKVKIGCHG